MGEELQEIFKQTTANTKVLLQPPEAEHNLDETVSSLCKYIEQPNTLKRLGYYTLKHIKLYFYSDTIKGATANDVVSEVISKVLIGKRKWNKNIFPRIDDFLRIAILSFIRNEAKRRDVVSFSETLNDDSYDWESDTDYYSKCIEDDIEKKLFASESIILIEKFIKEFDRDELAVSIINLILSGIQSQKDIAQKLKVDIKEVYKAFKRIRRRKKLAEQLFFKK